MGIIETFIKVGDSLINLNNVCLIKRHAKIKMIEFVLKSSGRMEVQSFPFETEEAFNNAYKKIYDDCKVFTEIEGC